ncbi:hypothetical protein HDV06_000253 [Boothiomyces sp. JEL0866]|nr:hypothetical protein HDV06_000253 [Boothiomyces sp. JEL0866]
MMEMGFFITGAIVLITFILSVVHLYTNAVFFTKIVLLNGKIVIPPKYVVIIRVASLLLNAVYYFLWAFGSVSVEYYHRYKLTTYIISACFCFFISGPMVLYFGLAVIKTIQDFGAKRTFEITSSISPSTRNAVPETPTVPKRLNPIASKGSNGTNTISSKKRSPKTRVKMIVYFTFTLYYVAGAIFSWYCLLDYLDLPDIALVVIKITMDFILWIVPFYFPTKLTIINQ